MTAARYAIYYAPEKDDPLSETAAAWLGRCAWTGEPVARETPPALAGLDLDALTADPRHYGFHATLTAPFELTEDASEAALIEAVAAFAAARAPFAATIAVQAISAFVAFRLDEPSAEMQALHEDCVRHFDLFRAPLSDFDFQRRRRPGMSPAQEAQLRKFGYVGILGDFRFHMTLTGAIRDEALHAQVKTALATHFAAHEGPHTVAGLSLFKQPDRDTAFRVIGWSPFAD